MSLISAGSISLDSTFKKRNGTCLIRKVGKMILVEGGRLQLLMLLLLLLLLTLVLCVEGGWLLRGGGWRGGQIPQFMVVVIVFVARAQQGRLRTYTIMR
jgi:hypothetical protein